MQRKLNAIIDMPEVLDISEFLLSSAKPTGELLGEQKKKKYSEENVAIMQDAGYDRNVCIRALTANNDNI